MVCQRRRGHPCSAHTDQTGGAMDQSAVRELLCQMIETELGGEQIYTAAIENAVNDELREEWQTYLEETRTHQDLLKKVFAAAGLDLDEETVGRRIVRAKGEALVQAIVNAREGDAKTAELVAAECVVEAEAKDLQNWELLSRVAEQIGGELGEVMQSAYEEAGDQEAEHFFHTRGWARELWIDFLGMEAALPPPEEEKSVTTQIGAGRAEHQREDYT